MDRQLATEILGTEPFIINGSKDNVRMYVYDGKRHFVRKYKYNTVNPELFNRLLSFELLRYMGIPTPNFGVARVDDCGSIEHGVYLFSEDCGDRPFGGVDVNNSEIDVKYYPQIARMIYIADLFNFSDFAKNNIHISNSDELIVIDFDLPGYNANFQPQNVFESNYSLAESFDLHTSKGIWELMVQASSADEPGTSIALSEEEKAQIEEKFFAIDQEFLDRLINDVKIKYFSNCDSIPFNDVQIDGYRDFILERIRTLSEQKEEAITGVPSQKNFSGMIRSSPKAHILYGSPVEVKIRKSRTMASVGMDVAVPEHIGGAKSVGHLMKSSMISSSEDEIEIDEENLDSIPPQGFASRHIPTKTTHLRGFNPYHE